MKLEKLIDKHWAYIEALLRAQNENESTIKKIRFHYKTAFRHGWKHRGQKSGK
ncbi:hypothetical protein LCGC14_1910410 [marine sediment metagenome]|uniref:Uncharacterized protein n=1 Tax=marine sediment metagenome TaxID=412755 RepID=A0A0F9IRV0_9ZZZZ